AARIEAPYLAGCTNAEVVVAAADTARISGTPDDSALPYGWYFENSNGGILKAVRRPLVANVRGAQRTGSQLVDIYYDFDSTSGTYSVEIAIEGVSNRIAAVSFTGDAGAGVAPGKDRHIVWDAGADWPDQRGDVQFVVKAVKESKVQLWEDGPYWATTNIGAEKPEDYGLYFWWGDTVGYRREGDAWVASDGSNTNFSFVFGNVPTFRYKSELLSEGWVVSTNDTYILAPEHDAAQVQWGEGWRMPTDAEFGALMVNCTTTWTTCNGVYGRLVTGKGGYSDKSIFLPAADNGDDRLSYDPGSDGYYWSSSMSDLGAAQYAYGLFFNSNHFSHYHGYRSSGFPVRPVTDSADSPSVSVASSGWYSIDTIPAGEALIHRWSFNNSLEDTGSIGGMTAVLGGNAALYNNTSVRVNAGGDGTSWVELGANPIPSDLGDTPFTIEVWATPTAFQRYASVFSLGERSDYNAKGLMGVFQGFKQINYATGGYGSEANGPVWNAVAGTVTGKDGMYTSGNIAMTPGAISVNTPYYFAYVVLPKGDGASASIVGYVYNASTGEQVGKSVTYTVAEWTTALLSQSWFGLGTTPWNDDNPGADYDEVRVWKKALTPGQIAANVARGPDAIPSDNVGSATRLWTESATLAHRWSFNGSLKDSVTGDEATMKGGFYSANGAVRFTGGGKDANYIALGADKMPSDSVTLEFFSTVYAHVYWAKMFCLGQSENNGICFTYYRGGNPGINQSSLEFKPADNIGITGPLEVKKPYLFTFTFSCNGTDTTVNGYCIDLANPGEIRGSFTDTLANWKMRENISLDMFNLGWSFWDDGAVNADFDEVRVWDGVFSEAEVLASSRAGADAVIATESASDAVLFEYDFTGG
ncbi:MAG: hypothetical protein IIT98_06320, partial [Kiritimatiellae bacterium]|nr:hypothetical protein [Kiritimatiellia bacterium]